MLMYYYYSQNHKKRLQRRDSSYFLRKVLLQRDFALERQASRKIHSEYNVALKILIPETHFKDVLKFQRHPSPETSFSQRMLSRDSFLQSEPSGAAPFWSGMLQSKTLSGERFLCRNFVWSRGKRICSESLFSLRGSERHGFQTKLVYAFLKHIQELGCDIDFIHV